MRIMLAPDSFKGSISAREFCEAAGEGILSVVPQAQLVYVPLADGGEGSLDCMLDAAGGFSSECEVSGAFYEKTAVRVGFFENGSTALIESAMAMGLPSVAGRENPEQTSSLGVGEMISFALEKGAREIILALGGSSTNDCGAGMLCALGTKFFDSSGREFIPVGGTLADVTAMDVSSMKKRLDGVKVTAMCDVNNPLCGENGCSFIYAPQKGADKAMVLRLDESCRHFSAIAAEALGADYSGLPGAGAAGGLGYACAAFLGGRLKSGIKTVLELCDFENKLAGCELLISGEGRFDEQSLMGKAIGTLLELSHGIPTAVLCGRTKLNSCTQYPNLIAIREISEGQSLGYAMSHGKENLRRAAAELIKDFIEHRM